MTNDNPGYTYAYGWNRFNMEVIGGWPEGNDNSVMKNRAWLYGFAIFVMIWIPMTASIPFLSDSLIDLIGCLVINIPVAMSIYKIVLLRWRRTVIKSVLSAMAKDWAITRSDEERNVMLENAKYARFISYMSVALASGVMLAFSSVRAWTAPQERKFITNETKLAIGMLYSAYFPYDTTQSRGFLPTWFSQFFLTILAMVGYSGPDSLIAMMTLHLCGQLATVRIALANIVDEECIKDPSIYWKRLSSIVQRHEELNRCGELLEASFNVLLLMQMIFCTLTFCFQGFVTFTTLIGALTEDGELPVLQMTFLIVHLFYTILHLFVYCWTGDLLVVESTALSYAPYESDWFNLSPAQAKALMMITNRSRIPLQMTAGKFVGFSLELFTSIMKTSMGYLSVLLAMLD